VKLGRRHPRPTERNPAYAYARLPQDLRSSTNSYDAELRSRMQALTIGPRTVVICFITI
jgi:hypothetical protein